MTLIQQNTIFTVTDLLNFEKISNNRKKLAVFADPVAHSLSPRIHNSALKKRSYNIEYIPVLVKPVELSDALHSIKKSQFLGVNLTIPHKINVLKFLDQISFPAYVMQSVNTLLITRGMIYGFNTDGIGFSAAIVEKFSVSLSELRILILGGAGGAGRAITVQSVFEQSPRIIIANRSTEKGKLFSEDIFKKLGKEIESIGMDEVPEYIESVDMIVNATPLGMKEDDRSPISDGLLRPYHFIYDTVYHSNKLSPLLKQAEQAQSIFADGLSMLLHQAAFAYQLWFNEPAPFHEMRLSLLN